MKLSTLYPKGAKSELTWFTASTPSVADNESEGSGWYVVWMLPVKCLASCRSRSCMSSRTVPNAAVPSGFPGPIGLLGLPSSVQLPVPVGNDPA